MSTAQLMDGRTLAAQILDKARSDAAALVARGGPRPTLATILVGEDPASATYVRMKVRRCEQAGLGSVQVTLPAGINTEQLTAEIARLARDLTIHGILLQHPVPPPVDRRAAFEAIPVEKDVDGVTSASLGRVALGMEAFGSCTPAGIMRLLEHYQVDLCGQDALVVGRSPILGKPMAAMLLNADATVTVCHSQTRDLPAHVRRADVVIAALGKPRYIQGDWIKPGAVVVDAGYSDGNVGDVDFEPASRKARLITPVPGGVGPMTIAILLQQTVRAAEQQSQRTAKAHEP